MVVAVQFTKWLHRLWRDGLPPGSSQAYLVALICIAIASALQFSLDWMARDVLPFSSLFPAILAATLIGGLGPGIFAVFVSALLREMSFAMSGQYLVWPSHTHAVNLLFFLLCCALTVWIAEGYRRMLARVRQQEQELDLLMRELQHRGRNTIAVAQAIVRKTLPDNKMIAAAINSRLDALLSTNEQTFSDTKSAELSDILKHEIQPYGTVNVKLAGEPILLPSNLAKPLRLVFHELATNAAKYGALSSPNGTLSISWFATDGQIRVRWIEHGGPPATQPIRKGFGTLVLSRVLTDFGGSVVTDYGPEGVSCEIFFDFDKVVQPMVAGSMSSALSG